MQITFYQLLVPFISFFAIVYAWNLVMRRKKSIWEALLWTAFWGVLAAIAIWPDMINVLTAITGIQDRENAVFITSLGVLFFLVFFLVMRIEELTRQHHRFIRAVALEQFSRDVQTSQQSE